MPNVDVQNLTDLANKGEGKTAGSRLGHESIKFRFAPPAETSFTFDDWTNIKNTSLNPSKADLRAAVAWASQDTCKDAVESWDRESSFFDYLARKLFFTNDVPAANWCDPKSAQNWMTLVLRAGVTLPNAPEQLLFKFLLSGSAISYWRESSGMTLSIGSANLYVIKPGSAAKKSNQLKILEDYTMHPLVFDWHGLIKRMRGLVRTWIKQNYGAKANYLENAKELDTEIVDILSKVSSFKLLYNESYVSADPHGNGYDTHASKKIFLGDSKETDKGGALAIALNHARFVMWMEWRMATELCLRVNGGIF